MELMSMLLLCAFAASLPQSLGVHGFLNTEMKLNSSIIIENSISTRNRRRQRLSPQGQSMVGAVSEFQSIFGDNHCKRCVDCMERILRAQNNQTQYIISSHHPEDSYYDKQQSQFQLYRNKRNIRFKRNHTDTDLNKETIESKTMAVTKYTNEDGKIYAIKVNEINRRHDEKSTCKVYSVKKTFPCGSGASDLILNKRKISKKGKKTKVTAKTTAKPTSGVFKKREVRIEPHMPESFMPSIEEIY